MIQPPLPPPVPPTPFGDPTQVRRQNTAAAGKGIFFGCGGCLLLVCVVTALGLGILAIVFGAMRNSDVVTQALEKAQASVEVKSILGTPLKQGWMFSGKIQIYGSSGWADISFPVTGPKGSGTVRAAANKRDGRWIFSRLLVVPDKTGKPIDLLAPLNVVYNCSISLPCSPSNPPLLNTTITSPDFVCDFSRSMIDSVEGS